MFKRSWSVVGGLIVCLTLFFTGPMLSARSQSNVDEVIATEITAESRSGEHPLITTYVSVLDDRNEFVSGLRTGDFTVREFTEPVSGISTSVERQGVAVDVLVDISGSMEDRGTPDKSRLQDVQWAAGQFLGDLSGGLVEPLHVLRRCRPDSTSGTWRGRTPSHRDTVRWERAVHLSL